MYKKGTYVVYKRQVCKLKEIKENYFKGHDYYILEPVEDPSLLISIPVETKEDIRQLISKEELEKVIKQIPSVEIIKENDRSLETEYRKLLNTDNHLDLIKIIKTTYLRNKERLDDNKKISEKDNNYFEKAEKQLYTEFSIILGLDFEETKKYIVDKVIQMSK